MDKLQQLQHNLCDAMDNVMQCLMDVREGCEQAIADVSEDLDKTRDKIKEEQALALVDIETKKKEWEETQRQFEERQAQARKHAESAANVIQLNVGGKNFCTTKNTLLTEPNTFFHAMLHSGAWTLEDGNSNQEPFFVDRNPEFFSPILDYLRDGKLYANMLEKMNEMDRERFVSEVEFYSIGSLLRSLGQCEITGTGTIMTIAGNGTAGYSGDGGQALSAELNSPFGVCFHQNNLYIADANNHRIRIVSLSTGLGKGKITSGAGNGEVGSDGDGGLAVTARLTAPNRVAIDADKMYITEYYENCIRSVDINTGIITTMAGSGVEGHAGDGGPAIQAQLCGPSGIAISDGKMYFAENKSHCIRMIDLKSGRIQTLAGQPGKAGNSGDGDSGIKALLNGPNDIAVRYPTLYFSDSNSHRVRALDLRTNHIKTVAGCGQKGYSGDGGVATEAKLCAPVGLALHLNQLFIADCANHCIRQVDLNTNTVSTFCGTGVSGYSGDGGIPTGCQLASPIGLAVSHNQLFIADKDNNCIRVVG